MGSEARRQEVKSLADHLSSFRELKYLKRPANLEGGDVMRVDHTLYIGISSRTNLEGLEQLTALLSSNGYQTQPVRVAGCLHLKTGCTYLGRNTLLVNPDWVDTAQFQGFKIIAVHPSEPWGANALTINGVTLLPSAFPKTAFLLEEAGFKVETLDISELLKAEAGLTCLSLIFNAADTLNIQ
jgi:dimethylargininase